MVELEKSEIKLALFLSFIGFVLRLLPTFWNKYYMNVDSYYYVNIINDGVFRFSFMELFGYFLGLEYLSYFLAFISVITIFMFYFTCRQYANPIASYIAKFAFAVSPLVFFNNQFGIIDKNIPSMFMIVFIIFIMGKYDGIKRIIGLLLSLAVFAFIWHGWFGMLAIICLYYFSEAIIKKDYRLIGISLLFAIGFLFKGYEKFAALNKPEAWYLISELNPIWNIGFFWEYIIVIVVWILIFTKIKLDKHNIDLIRKNLFLYLGFVVMFFYMTFMFRINIFFLPFLYICLAIVFDDLEYRFLYKGLFFFILIVVVMILDSSMYVREPIMNDDVLYTMEYVNSLNSSCIIGNWGMGHIYDAYTDKKVRYKGSSNRYLDEIDYMVYGNDTDCIIIWNNNTVDALNYMLVYLGKDINTSEYYIVINENNSMRFGDFRVIE